LLLGKKGRRRARRVVRSGVVGAFRRAFGAFSERSASSERRRPVPANARPSPAANPTRPIQLREVAAGAPRLAQRTRIAVRRWWRGALRQADRQQAHTRRT